MPFTEMMFYYDIMPKPVASPLNWGNKDPINEFVKQLRQESSSENWKLAKKIEAKTRIFVPIVVRGEEEEGVKLWQFGKLVYTDFLNMAADDEIGDFTDIAEGRDIKLTTIGPDSTGTKYNKTTISPSLKISPISEDVKQIEEFLENQTNPKDVFKQYTFDEIKEALQNWLTPEDEEEDESISEIKPKTNYSSQIKKQSKSDKFDDLFKEKE